MNIELKEARSQWALLPPPEDMRLINMNKQSMQLKYEVAFCLLFF